MLDVWIASLSLEPYSHDSSRYRLKFTAYLRLIDAKVVHLIDGKKGLVVADGACARSPEETPSAPTYDDLLADGARRLKQEVDVAMRFCVDEFRARVLTTDAP